LKNLESLIAMMLAQLSRAKKHQVRRKTATTHDKKKEEAKQDHSGATGQRTRTQQSRKKPQEETKGETKDEAKQEESNEQTGNGKQFEDWDEPKIKWRYSRAKQLLYKDLVEGIIPLKPLPDMSLEEIYVMHAELSEYHYSKFSSRLSGLRDTVRNLLKRKELDQEAYDNYKENHAPALFTPHGFIQWQGSEAQKQCKQDIKDGKHLTQSRAKFRATKVVYRDNFPLKVFHDKVKQEIHTAKYLHTLKERGKDPRKKK
jgi:hypothetical protein